MTDVLDRLKAALAERYRVDREIGAGGMATVYLAEDIKHHRQVAIKVLRPELAAVMGAERFLREIEIAARLQHPHILPLYDSGEADGLLYYVMPFVEGESLRQRLDREKQLPIEDALKIAQEVGDALSFAHSRDVIHRDIKPENILFEGGHAVVSDFGIARAVTAAGGDHLTETGMAIGTPKYMSPEQAAGSKDLDGRSDLYSLGCVLYEMLAGQPPFTGPTVESVIKQHLTAEPPNVTAMRPAVPADIVGVLARALAKTPADRFSPVGVFVEALAKRESAVVATAAPAAEATTPIGRKPGLLRVAVGIVALATVFIVVLRILPGGSPAASEVPRLAVLPFSNLGSPEDEYFADGITEEITSRIAEISGLRVISRQSAIQYKGSDKTLKQIGEELSVSYVLEGTIRTDRAPDGSGQVRVTPQLIRVSDDAHLWTNRYTASLVPGEIFGVQEQIANQVAQALDVTLLEPERQRLAARPTDNLEAYDYLLRGNDYYGRSYEEQNFRISIQMFQRAVELDPDFALAYARLSRAHSRMWWWFYHRSQERLALAREAVDQALRLDLDLPEAHEALGWYYYWGHLDYDRALAEFAIAQKSQPNSSDLLTGIAAVQRRQGKMLEALANFIKASELDPRSSVAAAAIAETYSLLRNPVQAARHFDRAIFLSPDWPGPYAKKARWLHLRLEGSTEKARPVLEQARSLGVAEDPDIAYTWVLLETWDGDYEEALDRLALVSSEVLWEDQFLHVPKAQL